MLPVLCVETQLWVLYGLRKTTTGGGARGFCPDLPLVMILQIRKLILDLHSAGDRWRANVRLHSVRLMLTLVLNRCLISERGKAIWAPPVPLISPALLGTICNHITRADPVGSRHNLLS